VTTYTARAQIRAALACWPCCGGATRGWLDALPWRVRQCVEGVHGDRCTAYEVSCRLGISISTVRADLRIAYQDWRDTDHDSLRQELVG
jgi:hypothetical protein